MSVYPLFLILGSDGTIGGYAREDIMRIDLALHMRDGQPARQVYKLDQQAMFVTYVPTTEFSEMTVPLLDLCQRHQLNAIITMTPKRPEAGACADAECVAAANGAKGQSA